MSQQRGENTLQLYRRITTSIVDTLVTFSPGETFEVLGEVRCGASETDGTSLGEGVANQSALNVSRWCIEDGCILIGLLNRYYWPVVSTCTTLSHLVETLVATNCFHSISTRWW